MNGYRAVVANPNPAVQAFAAELTNAAYAVALRHGTKEHWLDLELGLWNALSEVVKEWQRKGPAQA